MSQAGLGPFCGKATASVEVQELWSKQLSLPTGPPKLGLTRGTSGGRLPTASPLPRLGSAEDPGRMIKDWNYYKYRPHTNMSNSLNKYGPDYRWPGLNNTPKMRHHLAVVKRPVPKNPLEVVTCDGVPRMERGPGDDMIHAKILAEQAAEQARKQRLMERRKAERQTVALRTAAREHLEARLLGYA